MAHRDDLAIKNSHLNTFLLAEIGIEPTGLSLTILSVLARLDRDPWATAACWARESTGVAVEALAADIMAMELDTLTATDARAIATNLVPLLQVKDMRAPAESRAGSAVPDLLSVPKWAANVLLYGALALGLGASLVQVPAHSTRPTAAIEQSIASR